MTGRTSCAACGAANRERRKFCADCGAPLPLGPVCGSCGATNEPGERFCGECGQALDAEAVVAAQAPSSEGERKQVTVLFADVERSMDLAARLDPEELAAVMGRLFALCAEGVERFEGTVVKFTGDGVMALFGAPVAYEDHARRACLAGLHLQASVSAFAAELLRTRDLELRLRVGLHSGEVVAGVVGLGEYTAVGHAVGMAQRVQALGEPGTVCLSEVTARLVAGDFDLHDLGRFEVKGAASPVVVFTLTGSAQPRAAGRRPGRDGSASLVGRDVELSDLLAALERARCGQAQVVGIVGEAGVGKSRLCDEFARRCTVDGVTVRRAAGLAHAHSVPLLPILAWLRDSFAITDDDPPAQAREKIAGRVVLLDPALVDDLSLLFDFLEVPDPARPAPPLGPEARQRRILDVLRHVIQRRSERETLVVVLEDLHWFDPQSAAFLEAILHAFPGTRTLVVTNFRPEFQAAWMGHSYYRQLPLAPLPPEATTELLTALAGADPSLASLAGPVAARTGGNPFFIEEVVRSLAEDGTLEGAPGAYRLARPLSGEIGVPASVQAVLAARIDRLPERERAVLQTASVVGRTFSAGILAAVAGLPGADLEAALAALCAAELLQETGGSREYRFWHPLTQEVAYGTLLGAARRRLHAAVAQAVVALDPDRLDERAALVAHHYEAAGEPVDAAHWNDRAASWSLRTDLGEAQRRWRATISLLSAAPKTPESVRLGVHVRSKLLRYLARSGVEAADADCLAEEARCMATSIGDASLPLVVVAMAATVRFFQGEVAAYLDSWREVLRLADALGDATLRSFGAACIGLGTSYVGPLSEGLGAFETAGLSAVDPAVGVVEYGFSMHDVGHTWRCLLLAQSGQLAEAGPLLSVTRAFYRERPSPEWDAWTLSLVPRLADWTGEPDDAVGAAAHEAVRVAEDSGFVSTHVTALQAMGVAKLLHRNPGGAAATFGSALNEAREHRSGLQEEASLLAYLTRALLAMGNEYTAKARTAAEEAVAVAHRQGARVVECAALLTRAQVLREAGVDLDQARVDLDSADRLAADTGATTYAAFLAEERARLDHDDAALAEVGRRYQAIGATGHARRIEETGLRDA
jgi:class 3 adenylate cyclase